MVLEDRGERALDYPAARQHLEALGAGTASDDLERDAGLVGGPLHETAGIAAIGADAVDERVALARALERELATVAVLEVGTVDADCKQPAVGIGQDVALAPGDLLGRVVALVAPF